MINLEYIKGANLNVLDFGCGSGNYTSNFVNLGHNVTAIDINADYEREITKKINSKNKDKFIFKTYSDISDLNIGSNIYDLIICIETLEHIEFYIDIINYFKMSLKIGGLLIISVPTYLSEKFFSILDKHWLEDSKHINIFKEKTIMQIMKYSGFELKAKERKGSFWAIIWFIFKLFRIRHNMGVPIEKNRLQRFVIKITFKMTKLLKFLKPVIKITDIFVPKSVVYYFIKK